MNIKYLFVVSLTLFFLTMPKNAIAQEEFDIEVIDPYSIQEEELLFPDDDFADGDQQIITTSARSLQNASAPRRILFDDFKYRWYIQAGGGAQFLMGEDDSKGSFQNRLTMAPSITGGYRWNPVFGVRLNITGGTLHGYNDGHSGTYRFWKGKSDAFKENFAKENGFFDSRGINNIDRWDPQWDYKGFQYGPDIHYDTNEGAEGFNWIPGGPGEAPYRGQLYMQHLRYAAANAAVTMNLMNLFGGANDDRKFDVSMHAGPTYFHIFPHQGTRAYDGFGINGGIQAQYHISDKIGVFTEFSGMMLPDGFDGHYGGDTFDLVGQAFLGMSYKFPTDISYTPSVPLPRVEDNDELNNIRASLLDEMNKMVDLQPEIDRLRAQLAALDKQPTTETIVEEPEKQPFLLPEPVHFAIGKTDIDVEGWGVIERVSAYLNNNPDATVIITGYADKDTGTDAINERLSKERSRKVADALTQRYNIPQNRVAIDWRGDKVQPFFQNKLNRAVIFYVEFD